MPDKELETMLLEGEYDSRSDGMSSLNPELPEAHREEVSPPPAPSRKKVRRPTSQRQMKANRINGAKSQGPRTVEGKRKSSKNSLKHGILAKKLLSDENGILEDLDLYQYYIQLHEEYRADTLYEQFLLDDLLFAYHGYHRTVQLERLAAKQPGYMFALLPKLQRYHTANRNIMRQNFAELNELREIKAIQEEDCGAVEEACEEEAFDTRWGDDPLGEEENESMDAYRDYIEACNIKDMLLGPVDPRLFDWCDSDDLSSPSVTGDTAAARQAAPSGSTSNPGTQTKCQPAGHVEQEPGDFSGSSALIEVAQPEPTDKPFAEPTDRVEPDGLVPEQEPTGPNAPSPVSLGCETEVRETTTDRPGEPVPVLHSGESTPSAITVQQQIPQRGDPAQPDWQLTSADAAELLGFATGILTEDDDKDGERGSAGEALT
jgi:hypothetical protein